MKYLTRSFLVGSTFSDAKEAQSRLCTWLNEVCNQRIHGTTLRRPEELFVEAERAALLPLPDTPFSLISWQRATVHPDSHFVFKKRPYSAPFSLIGQKLWGRASEHSVEAYHDDKLVATHAQVSSLHTVQAIVTHLESFPPTRAQATCRRALHYGCFQYRGIKDILRLALDLLPLSSHSSQPPTGSTPPESSRPLKTPRYARPIASLLSQQEDSHDWN